MSAEQYPEIECAPPESSWKPIARVNQAKVDTVGSMAHETRVRNIFKIRIPGIAEDLQYRISRAGGRTSLGGKAGDQQLDSEISTGQSSPTKIFPRSVHIHIRQVPVWEPEAECVPEKTRSFGLSSFPRSLNPGLSYQNTDSPNRKAQGMKQGLERNWWKVGFQRTFPSAPINVILYLYNRVSPTDSGTKLFL